MNLYRLAPTLITLLPLLVVSFAVAPPALAQLGALSDASCGTLGIACDEDADAESAGTLLIDIVNVFLAFAGFVAMVMIIIGGIQYVIAMGDENKLAQAKNIILYSIIGLIVIGLAAVTVNFVVNIFAGGGEE